MRQANLTLHCGAGIVEREQVERVRTPDPSGIWRPIPHNTLIEFVENALSALDLGIVNQSHALTRDGNRYFGLMQVDRLHQPLLTEQERDYTYIMGLRNSHDKSFPAGLVIGQSVFVCDNLSFSGEISFARKHTTHILEDLPALTTQAVGRLCDGWTKTDQRMLGYKQQEISREQAHDIVVDALDAKAITAQQLPDVLKEFRAPRHEEFEKDVLTMWRLFNSFTEVMKSTSLTLLPRRSIALQGSSIRTATQSGTEQLLGSSNVRRAWDSPASATDTAKAETN